MSRIVLALHDAGGTVPPMQAIAAELVARGHHVVVRGQPSVRARMEDAGATFEAWRTLPDYDHSRSFDEQLDLIGSAMVGRSLGDELLEHAADAAAYVVDCNLAGALSAAESTTTPTVALLHSLRRTYVDIWFGELWPLLAAPINETRAAYGLDDVGSWSDLFARQARQWSVVPETFDLFGAPAPPNHRHLGWTVPRTPPGVRPVAGDEPIVLVSFSTTSMDDRHLLQAALDGLGQLDVHGIATVASRVGHAGLRVPANVEIHDVLPHAALMPHVAAVVTHAGLGTVAVALSHGVPIVCLPIERDQPHNAETIAALGAGRTVAEPTADAVAATVRHVLEDDGHRRAAERLAGATGASAAADDLAACVGRPTA